MSRQLIAGITLDTGALIALDHRSKAADLHARIRSAHRRGAGICIPVGVVAQAWRSSRQVRLAHVLRSPDVEIVGLTLRSARAVGLLCAQSGHSDIVDVHVALCARERGHAVITSDPEDLKRVDPGLTVVDI